MALTLVFWISAAGLVYAYVGYPLLLLALTRARRDDAPTPAPPDPPSWPTVALLVPMHNERANVEAKLANTLALRYPDDRLQAYFISDRSTDGTNEFLRDHPDPRVTVLELTGRGGKAAALNHVLPQLEQDIVVFNDASIMLRPDAIEEIVKPFTDPRIGCVSGEDRIAEGGGEGLYGRYELFVRRQESTIGSLIGASGSFYAQRRELCAPFVPNLAPDFWSVLHVVDQGRRAVAAPNAVGSMKALESVKDEFGRKVRTLLRGMTTLGRYAHMMNPLAYGFFAVQLLSHKLARWLVPVFLLGTLISSGLLARDSWFFLAVFAAQGLLYAFALAAHLGIPGVAAAKLPRVCLYFVVVNVATALAWLKFVTGVRQELWSPSRR
jgi:cellulose synthase/poly-beta-1,6-N-acetylglucosamine synthase-like glycosyltransferase